MCIIMPQCDRNMCSTCMCIYMFVSIAIHVHMCICQMCGEMEVNVQTLHRRVLGSKRVTVFKISHICIFL